MCVFLWLVNIGKGQIFEILLAKLHLVFYGFELPPSLRTEKVKLPHICSFFFHGAFIYSHFEVLFFCFKLLFLLLVTIWCISSCIIFPWISVVSTFPSDIKHFFMITSTDKNTEQNKNLRSRTIYIVKALHMSAVFVSTYFLVFL